MNDTTEKVGNKYSEMMMSKSPEERMMMGFSMFMFAKTLVKASLQQDGKLSPAELRQKLFMRFYANDFNDVEQQKILKHLKEFVQ